MATFTMTLKEVLDTEPDIGLDVYPIFDEAYREGLNSKIINHFWNREIGQETVSMFIFALRRKMNEIMPLYNQRYLSTQLEFDPLSTVDIRTVSTGTGSQTSNGQSSTESTSDAKSRAVAQELPQSTLADDGDYATNAQDNVSNTTATGTADESSTVGTENTGESSTKGYQGAAALLLMQYRQSLINVDMEIINELESLFMLVWDNGDSFTQEGAFGYGYFGYGRYPTF